MSNPCEQKDNIEDLKKGQDKLFGLHDEKLHMISEMRVTQVKIEGDITHIKGRLDNGMSHSIHSVDVALTKLIPIIEHHSSIIKRVEDIGWWLSKLFIGALIGIIIWAAAHGWTP